MKTTWILAITTLFLSVTQAWADAELFLRINDGGRYTVSIEDQTITLSRGKFRFFELPEGRQRLVILRNNTQVYEDWIDLRNESRTVVEFIPRRGVRVVTTYPLYINGRYCGPEWEQGYANNGPGRNDWPGQGPGNGPDRNQNWPDRNQPTGRDGNYNAPAGMSRFEFDQLKARVSRESFDEKKFDLLRNVLPGRGVSTAQLSDLLRQFSFDKYRLETAKVGWESVSDRNNFYTVFDTFSFESSKRDLKQHIGWK